MAVWLRSCSSVVMASKYSWRMPCACKTHQMVGNEVNLYPAFPPKMQLAQNNFTGQITVRNRGNFPRQTAEEVT